MTEASAQPLVSVVMGVYNCVDTIDEALGSLVRQTYSQWEVVVCDDASTDGTYEKLLGWQDRHPDRFQVLRNPINRKLSYTLNRCLTAVRGSLVARMDGDDISVCDRFERQVAYLATHPEAHLVGSAMQRFSRAGDADVVHVEARPDRWTLRRRAPFCHATIMARREVYDRLGGYVDDYSVERTEDLDLWFRFYAAGFVGHNITEPLYRVREDLAAIRRRTWRNRLNVLRVNLRGFRLLGYPRHWYARPVIAFGKAMVPAQGAAAYRTLQSRIHRLRSVR